MHLLQAFLAGPQRNDWITFPNLTVYLRKSRRLHPTSREVIKCFDIANVSTTVQGQGIFTAWLAMVQAELQGLDFDAIYVESVQTDQFADHFRKLGWVESSGKYDINFFLMLR